MILGSGRHLSYCTNVHPGANWDEVWENLQGPVNQVRRNISPDKPFAIGMWWAHETLDELAKEAKAWEELNDFLTDNNCYVFTLNAFPYGRFHGTSVKDKVHEPDWTSRERLDYSLSLFELLSKLPNLDNEGGISTSPLSYRHWHKAHDIAEIERRAVTHFAELVRRLAELEIETGRLLHIDIEPEPDGLIENSNEMVAFFNNRLLTDGAAALSARNGISREQAELLIRRHIRVCFDICHFSVVYEKPIEAIKKLNAEGISIGKLHISAALKWSFDDTPDIQAHCQAINEPTYLHQVVQRNKDESLSSFTDLPQALENFSKDSATEWRTHFHVPLFADVLPPWETTKDDVIDVLSFWKEKPFTNHLEIETYTWAVLPKKLQLPLVDSITKEYEWVFDAIA